MTITEFPKNRRSGRRIMKMWDERPPDRVVSVSTNVVELLVTDAVYTFSRYEVGVSLVSPGAWVYPDPEECAPVAELCRRALDSLGAEIQDSLASRPETTARLNRVNRLRKAQDSLREFIIPYEQEEPMYLAHQAHFGPSRILYMRWLGWGLDFDRSLGLHLTPDRCPCHECERDREQQSRKA